MSCDSLGDRMKQIEQAVKPSLLRKVPLIIRCDGKAFHSLTAKLDRPYDARFHLCMATAACEVAGQIQGCKFAFVQSDEVSFLLTDYDRAATDAWFGNDLQKVVSLSAALMTVCFYQRWLGQIAEEGDNRKPIFDSRAFSIPPHEVENYFIWRQQDATRNSINMLGQHFFSHRELHGKSTDEVQEMLMTLKGVNWNDQPVKFKRGSCVYKVETDATPEGPWLPPGEYPIIRSKWTIDNMPPIFTQDREYIRRHVYFGPYALETST